MPGDLGYGKCVLIALDQLANSLLRGWPDETISSRAWRWRVDGIRSWPETVINALFFWDRDRNTGQRHCELAFESEREGRQLPPEARGPGMKTKAS